MSPTSLGPVPPSDDVTLLCSKMKQEVVDEVMIGPQPGAFRIDNDGLSVTWVQYFKPPPPSLEQAAQAIKSDLVPKKSSVYLFLLPSIPKPASMCR